MAPIRLMFDFASSDLPPLNTKLIIKLRSFISELKFDLIKWTGTVRIKVNQSPRMILSAIHNGITLGIQYSSVKGKGISHNGLGIDFLNSSKQNLQYKLIYANN